MNVAASWFKGFRVYCSACGLKVLRRKEATMGNALAGTNKKLPLNLLLARGRVPKTKPQVKQVPTARFRIVQRQDADCTSNPTPDLTPHKVRLRSET